jgi:hypothetical protein
MKAKPGARRHAVTAFLREHPNSTTLEIAKALGWTNEVTRNAIGNARTMFVNDRQRWSNATTTATDPPGTHGTPRTPEAGAALSVVTDQERASLYWRELNETKIELKAARDREAALATELDDLRAQKARFIDEEAELREWRCAIEDALGFESDEDNAPHIEVSVAIAEIRKLQATRPSHAPSVETVMIDELCKIVGATRETLVDRVRGGPSEVEGEPMRVMQVGESEQFGPCVTLTCDRTAAKQLGERLYEHVTVTL